LFEPDADKDNPRIGMIDPHCKVKSVIMEAFDNAACLCEAYYDIAPGIEIKGKYWRTPRGVLAFRVCERKNPNSPDFSIKVLAISDNSDFSKNDNLGGPLNLFSPSFI
jgi:hypothetical protein